MYQLILADLTFCVHQTYSGTLPTILSQLEALIGVKIAYSTVSNRVSIDGYFLRVVNDENELAKISGFELVTSDILPSKRIITVVRLPR